MTTNGVAPVDVSSDGEWTPLFEDLLRGLVHAINNRVTALGAFAELASFEDEPLEIDALKQEINRLHGVSSLIGVLATRNDEMEALELSSVMDIALNVHSHHPRMRSVPCTVETRGSVLPVRVPRWAMLRLCLLMIDAAKRTGSANSALAVTVGLSGDEQFVRAHFVSSTPMGGDAMRLASRCGGVLQYPGGETVLELPSLLELRKREREAR